MELAGARDGSARAWWLSASMVVGRRGRRVLGSVHVGLAVEGGASADG